MLPSSSTSHLQLTTLHLQIFKPLSLPTASSIFYPSFIKLCYLLPAAKHLHNVHSITIPDLTQPLSLFLLDLQTQLQPSTFPLYSWQALSITVMLTFV